jgi:hypothetical protein
MRHEPPPPPETEKTGSANRCVAVLDRVDPTRYDGTTQVDKYRAAVSLGFKGVRRQIPHPKGAPDVARRKSAKKKASKRQADSELIIVKFEISARQRELVLAHKAAPQKVLTLFETMRQTADTVTIELPHDAVERFLQGLDAVIDNVNDPGDHAELNDLGNKLATQYDEAMAQELHRSIVPEGFEEALKSVDRRKWTETETFREVIAKVQAMASFSDEELATYVGMIQGDFSNDQAIMGVIEKIANSMGNEPQEDFCHLTWDQFLMLDESAWDPDSGALVLTETLTMEELEHAPLFGSAQTLLMILTEMRTVHLRKGESLGRALVDFMFEEGEAGEDGYVPDPLERDQLARLFNLCAFAFEFMDWIRIKGKTVTITKAGKEMAAPENTGALFPVLFQKLVGQVDWSGGDFSDVPAFERHFPYFLYVVSTLDEEWHRVEDMKSRFVPPLLHLAVLADGDEDPAPLVVERFLVPSEGFGLVEMRGHEASDAEPGAVEFRKTPLFDKFIEFDFEFDDYSDVDDEYDGDEEEPDDSKRSLK